MSTAENREVLAVRRDAEHSSQSLGNLLKQLAADTSTLARCEARLAQAEMAEKAKQAAVGGAMMSGAGVTGHIALLVLVTCAIAALATAVQVWLAALIVAAVLGTVAAALMLSGRTRLRKAMPLVPKQAIEGVKEDVRWLKTRRHYVTK